MAGDVARSTNTKPKSGSGSRYLEYGSEPGPDAHSLRLVLLQHDSGSGTADQTSGWCAQAVMCTAQCTRRYCVVGCARLGGPPQQRQQRP
jgi:hypothetical protein